MPLRVLEYLSKTNPKVYDSISIFAVQHLLMDSVDFFQILLKHFPQEAFIIGIPYSSKPEAVERIRAPNAKIEVPSFDAIYEFVEQSLSDQLCRCSANKRRVLILEDGGYAAPALHGPICRKNIRDCIGVVEQTRNGLWRDREIPVIEVPLCHVAESILKDSVEGPAVGEAVVRTLENILGSAGHSLASKKVAVVGYGTIGMSIAKQMKKRGALVMCNDTRMERHIAARIEGVEPRIKMEMLSEADLIIGATGTASIGADEILRLKHGACLASASSKNIEIDVAALRNLGRKTEQTQKQVTKHRLVNDREIFLISNGFPVNFSGEFSIPNEIMDLIFSELFLCILAVAEGKFPPGIHAIPYEFEKEVASIWEKLYY